MHPRSTQCTSQHKTKQGTKEFQTHEKKQRVQRRRRVSRKNSKHKYWDAWELRRGRQRAGGITGRWGQVCTLSSTCDKCCYGKCRRLTESVRVIYLGALAQGCSVYCCSVAYNGWKVWIFPVGCVKWRFEVITVFCGYSSLCQWVSHYYVLRTLMLLCRIRLYIPTWWVHKFCLLFYAIDTQRNPYIIHYYV